MGVPIRVFPSFTCAILVQPGGRSSEFDEPKISVDALRDMVQIMVGAQDCAVMTVALSTAEVEELCCALRAKAREATQYRRN